ncbi:MAG: polysaccharide biosynthesis tyrosine autokinase [Bacteroidales bacterium]|nr:polysaccharide biosynthesis tyrosine autokinase [Bacteroidales bacterium]
MEQQENSSLQLPEEEGIDIKKYIYLILTHWWWFAITIFVSMTVAYLVNRYSQEVYSASCTVIVGEPNAGSGSVESLLDELSRIKGNRRKAVVENEITILKSYKLARMAIEELDFGISYTAVGRRNIAESQLYKNSPFIVIPDSATRQSGMPKVFVTLLSDKEYRLEIGDNIKETLKFGELYKTDAVSFSIVLRDPQTFNIGKLYSNKYYFSINNLNAQALEYSRGLKVEVNDEKGSILTLSITGYVKQQITDYLNKLSEVYIRSNLEEKNISSDNTILFIDQQLSGIIDSLETTGLQLQNFRSANRVIDLSKEGSFLLTQLQSLQSEKVALDLNEKYYGYLLDYIRNKTDYSDIVAPSVVGIHDELLNSLVQSLNQLNLQKRTLGLSVIGTTPQVTQINSQIDNTRNALQENLQNLVQNNSIAQKGIDERLVKINKEVQKLPATERQLINIQRKFSINDQIYTFLLQKRAEAGITKASNRSDHKQLDIARPENAVFVKPKVSMNYMLALALGGGLPLLLLLLVEFFNTKITDRRYLETHLHVPIVGNIGHKDEGGDLPVNEKPGSSMAESFRALRTNLQYILKAPDAKVIAISSAVSGEGKTFCSVNLATIFAMAGRKTLLVNLDLRRPKIHRVFNLHNDKGMSTYLIGRDTFETVVHETNISNLFVATSGPIPPNPAELIDSQQMIRFIEKAKSEYDFIIIDTPPVAIVSDTMTLKDQLDAFIFVIRHNYSDRQVIDLINHVSRTKMKNPGVVINDIEVKGYYGYSYRYEYGYGYSYSYRHDYYSDTKEKRSFLEKLLKMR